MRLLAAITAAILLVSALAGCNRNNSGDPGSPGRPGGPGGTGETPDYVFVAEHITLPEGVRDMNHLVYANGRLFFSSWFFDEETEVSGTRLFSLNIDGTNLAELPNYDPGEVPEGAMGSIGINGMRVDGDGNLWVFENGNFWTLNIPDDFDGEEWDTWQFHEEVGSLTAIRKLDSTGAEILSVDISGLTGSAGGATGGMAGGGTHRVVGGPGGTMDNFFIRSFNIDGDGNIYIAGESMMGGSTIFVLTNDGQLRFQIDATSWIDTLVRMSDGTIATLAWSETGMGRVLRTIDFEGRDWGEEVAVPPNAHSIITGGGEHALVFMDGSGLSSFDVDTGEIMRMLNWIDSDIPGTGIGNVIILPDGRVLCTNHDWDRFSGMGVMELIILTPVPYDTLPPRTIITLATLGLDWQLRSGIVNFNRTNGTYRIQVNDYSEFNTMDDWNAGLTRLTTELIAGRIPDILDVRGLPFQQYVARGLLLDLYQFIDADPEFGRGDFMETIFRATEINGGLYQIFPNFNINTMIGDPAVLGPGMGWNMNEFRDVLRANPQADAPLGMGTTRSSLMWQFVTMSMDEYVDWAAGQTHFDSEGFISLLEFAATFPEEFEWDWDNWIDTPELVGTGRQIMMTQWVGSFDALQMPRAIFGGGDVVFKGFPTESRSGHVLSLDSGLAITSRASDPEGAWQFVRTILTEDWQRENVQWGFPINSTVFNERLETAMEPQYWTDEDGNEHRISNWTGWGDIMIELGPVTQEDADMILALIDAVSGTFSQNESLMNIINEGAEDFFAGRRTAQDAARIIQSRASIFIAEQT